jgi:transcription elongation GreA/GreB family factor
MATQPESEQSAPRLPTDENQPEKNQPPPENNQPSTAADQRGGLDESQPASTPPIRDRGIAVGDTVRVRYLAGDRNILQITISETNSDPSQGIVHRDMPVAKALLGAEQGDEVEVLIGSYVRRAVVERIIKEGGPRV